MFSLWESIDPMTIPLIINTRSPKLLDTPHSELEITAGHQTFSGQIVKMTNQIPHATPQSLILCPSNVRPKHEPYF